VLCLELLWWSGAGSSSSISERMSDMTTAQDLKTDIQKNASDVLRIQPTEFKGYYLVDVRVFYKDAEAED